MVLFERGLREFNTSFEGGLQQRFAAGVFGLFVFLFEEVEVAVVVEYLEFGFVFSRAEQIRSQTRAPPDHLPELHPATHGFGEHQVNHFGHVDTGVEHVD